MKYLSFFIFTTSFIFFKTAFATELNCVLTINQEHYSDVRKETVMNQKTQLFKKDGLVSYITEKDNHVFELETFLADYDARIYSSAVIDKTHNQISSSLWGRDILIDILCKQ